MKLTPLFLALVLAPPVAMRAQFKLPAIIGDHMVLQQKQSNPIWGWDAPGTKVTITFVGQTKSAEADKDGKWLVKLDPMPANAKPQTMSVKGSRTRQVQDILIGEVWMCSGQSNMQWELANDWSGDIEALGSTIPQMRLVSVPQVGTQQPKDDFIGAWAACTPETCRSFSAVGFFFGRHLHRILGVPIGLIDNSWTGSAAEAWVRRESLEKDPRFRELMARTAMQEKTLTALDPIKVKAGHAKALSTWRTQAAEAQKSGKRAPPQPTMPDINWLTGSMRPANIFNGVLHPTLGYGLKGVIWYQGETNAGQALEYRDLFPFLIEQWRREWNQGDFPFYWVQLADNGAEKPQPSNSALAELREAQTLTMKLPNTGQCIITDLGEGKNIHPQNKHDVAARLVRWALAKDYGINVAYRSPMFKSMEIKGNKVAITFDVFGSSLRTFDVSEAIGFAICGENKVWQWANGAIRGTDIVEVWSEKVAKPIAVRYAWADNPVCNLISKEGFPVTPFRTDDFAMITKHKPIAPEPESTPHPDAKNSAGQGGAAGQGGSSTDEQPNPSRSAAPASSAGAARAAASQRISQKTLSRLARLQWSRRPAARSLSQNSPCSCSAIFPDN